MKDFSIELAAEQIVDQRTKEYFLEVLVSFINGSYRSATVMLWSVVVSDLVYKLQTLRDLYQDKTALSILESIEIKQQNNPTSPEWESFLLEEIKDRTHLLEVADYQHLAHLQKLRHLSAHPLLSSGNLLFSPNKETTRSLIRNSLEAVLLKPPIFTKKILNELVIDIAANKDFLPDHDSLKQYLEAKYFKNLHPSVEQELIKTLWKFCFRISNPDTDSNRAINLRTLHLVYERSPTSFRSFIISNKDYFSNISPNGLPMASLISFLAECPSLFSALTDAARIPLANLAHSDVNFLAKASYLSDDFVAHTAKLMALTYEQLFKISDKNWDTLVAKGKEFNTVQEVYGIGIKIYCNSNIFDTADSNFARFIEPHAAEFDTERLLQILNGIENNNQTYWRGKAKIDHPIINSRISVLGDIDMGKYPNFVSSLPEVC